MRRQFSVFDACVWGAQLSWWLNFYTPEQLLVTSTTALTAPETRMEVRAVPMRPRRAGPAGVQHLQAHTPFPLSFKSGQGSAATRVGCTACFMYSWHGGILPAMCSVFGLESRSRTP